MLAHLKTVSSLFPSSVEKGEEMVFFFSGGKTARTFFLPWNGAPRFIGQEMPTPSVGMLNILNILNCKWQHAQHFLQVSACPTFCIYIFPSVGMLNIFSMCRHAQHFVCHLAMKKQHTAQDPYRPDQGFQIESQRKRYQPWWNVPMRASHSGTWMGRFHSALRVYTIATDLHTHTHTYIRGCMQGHIHPVWRTLQK